MSTAGTPSRPGSINNSTPPESTAITLVDHTKSDPPTQQDNTSDPLQRGDSLAELSHPPSIDQQLSRRFTRTSLQHARTQRKYRRYQEDRIVHKNEDTDDAGQASKGKRAKGKTMVKDFWRGKKIKQTREEDAIIEILYENQRGVFTIGVPHFSSKSLLNFDPKAWTNARMRGSPVNITNAQVPDPNWEWAWKSWYVDMSRDVDEDGWEYSFAFFGTAWHGNHPWFHSFVRRRRWLRKRVRKTPAAGRGQVSDAHLLTPEYFTIHPSRTMRRGSINDGGSVATSGSPRKSFESDADPHAEVHDIATLLALLRRATIDREKIVLIRAFLRNADEELYYLADEMPHIMSLLIFQNSRQVLLKLLMDDLAEASDRQDELGSQGGREGRRRQHLLRATGAADKQVKKLDYWSDIRSMVRDGKTATAVDGSNWEPHVWQGADASGPLSNDYSDAKEPGKTAEEVRKEMEILDRVSTKDTNDEDSVGGRRGHGKVNGAKEDEDFDGANEDEDVKRAKVANEKAEEREEQAEEEEAVPTITTSEGEYMAPDEAPISLDQGRS